MGKIPSLRTRDWLNHAWGCYIGDFNCRKHQNGERIIFKRAKVYEKCEVWEVWSISLEEVINTEDCDVIVKEEAAYFQGPKLPSSKFNSLVIFLVFISDVATAHEIGENEDG